MYIGVIILLLNTFYGCIFIVLELVFIGFI